MSAFPETILGESKQMIYGKGKTRYGPVIWAEPNEENSKKV